MRPRLAVIVCGWCGCDPTEPCLLCQGRINELGEYADWLVDATKARISELYDAFLTIQRSRRSDLAPEERFLTEVVPINGPNEPVCGTCGRRLAWKPVGLPLPPGIVPCPECKKGN